MATLALFSIFSGLAGVLTVNIDRIMVQNYTSLSLAGIYTIMFFFGSMVAIPSRSLIKISSAYIADAWKDNDIKTIKDIYKKSVVNQTIIGLFILLVLWTNVDNIFPIIGNKYSAGKFVILFIGLSYLTDMLIGTANSILGTSKEFKKITYIIVTQGILIVVTNIIFIHYFGITGAAIGSFVSKSISNLLKVSVIKRKFGLFPYDKKILYIILAGAISYVVTIPLSSDNLILNIILKTVIPATIFAIIINILKVSEELNLKNLKNLIKSVK
jgi:O-antigen/teichoic acid export membrane protein